MANLKVSVTFKGTNYTFQMSNGSLLKELSKEIEKDCDIHVSKQKLIFKGKRLENDESTLEALGIRNNSKLMLLAIEENIEPVSGVEGEVQRVEREMEKIKQELEELKQQCQQKNSHTTSHLRKSLAKVTEDATKRLEHIDSLSLSKANNDLKLKRKTLVNNILSTLQSCDELLHHLDTSP